MLQKEKKLVREMARILRSGCGMEHIPTQLIRLSTMDSTGATVANMVAFFLLLLNEVAHPSRI